MLHLIIRSWVGALKLHHDPLVVVVDLLLMVLDPGKLFPDGIDAEVGQEFLLVFISRSRIIGDVGSTGRIS